MTEEKKIVRRTKGPSKGGPTLKSLAAKSNATDEKLGKIESSIIDLGTSITAALKAMNNPVSIAKDGIDSRDVYQHLDERAIEFTDGDPNDDVEVVRPGLCSVDSTEFKDKANQMRFDNEKVEIMVMASQSTYPDHTFNISVNGVQRLISRGNRQWLPRNYVEVLLRAKISTYGNNEVTTPAGDRKIENPETKSHRYPLQILTDNSPHGQHWLERVSNDKRV